MISRFRGLFRLVIPQSPDILAAVKSMIPTISAVLCLAAALPSHAADAGKGFDLKLVTEGFVSPTTMEPLHGASGALLVADQAGVIRVLDRNGKLGEQPFLDLRPKLTKLNQGFDERGLLGLALHPRFSENKKFYVVYSAPKRPEAPADWDHTMRLSEFTAVSDGLSDGADARGEAVLVQARRPAGGRDGHRRGAHQP